MTSIQAAVNGVKAPPQKAKLSDAERAAHSAENDALCIAAFTANGIADVQPRVNVLTYKRWIAQGRKVRKGEKSTKVGPFALFHVSQTDELPVGEQAPANKSAA